MDEFPLNVPIIMSFSGSSYNPCTIFPYLSNKSWFFSVFGMPTKDLLGLEVSLGTWQSFCHDEKIFKFQCQRDSESQGHILIIPLQ